MTTSEPEAKESLIRMMLMVMMLVVMMMVMTVVKFILLQICKILG